MVASLEDLAEQIGISNAIMGVTLSAAGTSLPAYIASRIAGEFGFNNLCNTWTSIILSLMMNILNQLNCS